MRLVVEPYPNCDCCTMQIWHWFWIHLTHPDAQLIEIQASNSKSLWFKRKCPPNFPTKKCITLRGSGLNNPVQILQMTYLSIQGTPMGSHLNHNSGGTPLGSPGWARLRNNLEDLGAYCHTYMAPSMNMYSEIPMSYVYIYYIYVYVYIYKPGLWTPHTPTPPHPPSPPMVPTPPPQTSALDPVRRGVEAPGGASASPRARKNPRGDPSFGNWDH